MPKKTMSLGDLQTILIKYKDELHKAKTKTTKAIKAEGELLDVSQQLVGDTAKALEDAEKLVSTICDQATLAIVVE